MKAKSFDELVGGEKEGYKKGYEAGKEFMWNKLHKYCKYYRECNVCNYWYTCTYKNCPLKDKS